MRRLRNIVTGWLRKAKLIDTTPAEKALSDLRLQKCENCSQAYKSKLLEIVNGEDRVVDALICNKCHCPCLEKSLVVIEKCPLNKW